MDEKLSAMLDGDVDDAVAQALFKRLKNDKALRDEWDVYCLLGDVIRDGVAPDGVHPDEGFVARVMSRLDDEPTVLSPQRRASDTPHSGFLRHHLLPIAASVMGVLAVSGVVATLSSGGGGDNPVEMVQVVEIPPVVEAPVVARATELTRRDFMVAHQAVAGGPMPAAVHYVRTVSGSTEE
jgi:sigma-E factor negative regulatory protein RseA